MAGKSAHGWLVVWSTLAAATGCGQILGVSDYEIDSSLDRPVVDDGGSGGEVAVDMGSAGAGGAADLGEVVPCDSADCCTQLGGTAVGVEMLKDGGFELGPVALGETPWREASTKMYAAITAYDADIGFEPKGGMFFVYLSGVQGETTSVYSENLRVPSDAGWMVVSGYRLFQIDTLDEMNEDFAGVALYSPAGDAEEIPFYWARSTDSTDGWGVTATWKAFEASWDAAPHQGLTRYLGLRGYSDSYAPDEPPQASSYLFDEISLKYFRCYE